VVPRIRAESTEDLPPRTAVRWQLRVHPGSDPTARPFELVGSGDDLAAQAGAQLSLVELRLRLRELRARGVRKPVLAPHADSRSQDLLDAVAVLDEQWPAQRRATVARVFERP
jgi:hypothetical protein